MARSDSPRPRRRRSVTPTLAILATVLIGGATGSMIAPAGSAEALDLSHGGPATWHDLPTSNPAAVVTDLTHDIDGNLWYYASGSDDLVRVDAATRSQTSFHIGTFTSVLGMVGAPDGSIWFCDNGAHTISRLDPSTGAIVAHPLTGVRFGAISLAIGADGAIWFGDLASPNLVHVDASGTVTTIPEPHTDLIANIVAAPDGRLWYVHRGSDLVTAFDPLTRSFTDIPVGPSSGPEITVSKSGSVWIDGDEGFTEIALDGTVTAHPVVAPGPLPLYIKDIAGGDLAGDDDNELYFLSPTYGFGAISSSGAVTFSRLDQDRSFLEFDGSGHLWVNDLWGDSLNWI